MTGSVNSVLAKQTQHDKSTTAIATTKRTAAINYGCPIDPGVRVRVPTSLQVEGVHTNLTNGVDSGRVLAENAIAQLVGQPASDNKDYPRMRGVPYMRDE
jgi:hypothetical protein